MIDFNTVMIYGMVSLGIWANVNVIFRIIDEVRGYFERRKWLKWETEQEEVYKNAEPAPTVEISSVVVEEKKNG